MRFLILVVCLQSTVLLAAPRVVTSVAPLQEITATLMSGVASPQSIIAEGASMHHFALRPSHMRLLQQAGLVIWIDGDFEAGFGRIAQTLPASAAQLELLPELGISDGDGHIWYSPRLLRRSIDIIAERLAAIDPAHESLYRANARRLSTEIAEWREQTLAQLQRRPPRYIVDHDFTRHFEADMGHGALAAIHDRHDDHGGLGELDRLEALLTRQQVNCLLTRESQPSPLALELARKYGLETIDLAAAPAGDTQTPPTILRLQQFAAALARCA